MALGSGDDELWSQFDLFADQKLGKQFDAGLFQDLDDSFDQGSFQGCLQDFDDSFPLGLCEGVDKSSAPAISDHILNINFPDILGAEDNLTSFQGRSEEAVDTHDSNSSDPLRHDCMWSGVQDVTHVSNQERGEKEKGSSYSSSIFDTPLQSDFETSDLDDQDVIQKCREKKVSLTSHIDADHCYVSSSSQGAVLGDSIGPKRGGHQGRQAVTPDKKHVTSIIIRKDEPRTRLVKTAGARLGSQSAAKFKFQMKFMRESGDAMPRTASLVRNTTNRNRTDYHKRKAAINNTFCPVKSEQIESRSTVQRGKYGKSKLAIDKAGKDIRDLHNSMERKRRVDLKRAFDVLKVCLPELAESDKASKLMILEAATGFCRRLKSKELGLCSERDREQKKNLLLKKKLQHMKLPRYHQRRA